MRPIATLCNALSLTSKGVARLCGVTPRAVNRWLVGAREPPEMARRLLTLARDLPEVRHELMHRDWSQESMDQERDEIRRTPVTGRMTGGVYIPPVTEPERAPVVFSHDERGMTLETWGRVYRIEDTSEGIRPEDRARMLNEALIRWKRRR